MAAGSRMTHGVVGLLVVLAVVVYAMTDDVVVSNVCYLGVMIGASVGAGLGALRAPAGGRLVPRLIAIGVALTAMGDVVWVLLDLRDFDTDVSLADPLWFASYLVLIGALVVVLGPTRRAGGRVDMDLVVDAVTIVVVSLLVFWSFSVDGIVADQSVSPFVRVVWAAYPVVDAILLALVVRVLINGRSRALVGASFAGGVSLWLAADIAYLQFYAGEAMVLVTDAAWMSATVLLAYAAWHRPGDGTHDDSRASDAGGWVAPLMIAVLPLLVPPALEIAADLRGGPDRPLELMVGMALLFALTFVRTGRLLRSEARAQRELEVARDAALAASRAKSMFLANMSHEIRTPLTTILASAEILEDTSLDELQLTLLAKMHRSGNVLMSLLNEVLDFSRIEAGQIVVQSVEFDLHAVVTDAVEVYAPRATQARIQLSWHLDPCVPRTVVGDPTRLLQIVCNLLDNALKFTPRGRVRLVVRPAPGAGAGVELIVEDTGIGIPLEEQDAVFESFRQVDGSMTRAYGGSGLGLAICKELSELMGGSISVHSQLGSGSRFVVRIPLTPAASHRTPGPAETGRTAVLAAAEHR